jgi:phosphate transport system protein
MLKELVAAWRERNTLSLVLDQFDPMLAHDQWMFHRASDAYWRKLECEDLQASLYARDKQVNELERAIRGEVARHLIVHPGHDVVACLILMSVVKDAERIGDYCKNVFEIAGIFRREYVAPQYVEPLKEIQATVNTLFDETRQAFPRSDTELAGQVIKTFGELKRRCDRIVEQLLRQKDDMPTDEAVSYGMLARHLKRIAAHLSNIASSVVTPVENLDFADESELAKP